MTYIEAKKAEAVERLKNSNVWKSIVVEDGALCVYPDRLAAFIEKEFDTLLDEIESRVMDDAQHFHDNHLRTLRGTFQHLRTGVEDTTS